MKKYQLVEKIGSVNTAESKAPTDVRKIAKEMGFSPINIISKEESNNSILTRLERQYNYFIQWGRFYNKIDVDSMLFIQFPLYRRELNEFRILKKLKKAKKVKIVLLVHDINSLRPDSSIPVKEKKRQQKEESELFNIADQIILHNNVMINYLVNRGIPRSKLINLKIFDYLSPINSNKKIIFKRVINIAGNLDPKKSKYLSQLNTINCNFILYGPNYHSLKYKNIDYRGSLAPDKVPKVLNKGLGLIWDGTEITTCSGVSGEYLKYNNPHKLSLYLSSGIPVVIWSKAAEAEFVKENKVGFLIDSLDELPVLLQSISSSEYTSLIENVQKVANNLKKGMFTKAALYNAIKNLEG